MIRLASTTCAACIAVFIAAAPVIAKDKTPVPPDVDLGFAGPMVGHTTATTSSIWMYAPADASLGLHVKRAEEPGEARKLTFEKLSMRGLNLRGQAWRAAITNLQPDTRYEFAVASNGETRPEHRGSFRTAPKPGAPAKFRLGLTSCMVVADPQDSWLLFLKDKPDLHLTLGDTTYADSADPAVQWRYHLRYRRVPPFAEALRTMPTYALWDDHDYGPNNSDGTQKGKEQSLDGWKRVWLNPGAGAPDIPGAFFTFAWGDVEFLVVDGRYHRSPNKAPDDENKTMLGKAQLAWLIAGLKQSKAAFKVIATGSTLHHSRNDGWRLYTHELHALFDAIKQEAIPGVVWMTGSLHKSLVWEHHESGRAGYPMVEVISSGIANSKTRSYATIGFDTTAADPAMTVRIVAGTGKVRQEQTWRLSQLTHSNPSNQSERDSR